MNIEQEKYKKLSTIDQGILKADEDIVEWHDKNTKQFQQLKDKINGFYSYIEQDKQQKEHVQQ